MGFFSPGGGKGQREAQWAIDAADVASAREIAATDRANVITDRRIGEGRDWQERMRSSAYQTSKADMEAAGLNPAVLMAGSGGVASAPGTSAPGAIKADVSGADRAASARSMSVSARKRDRTQTAAMMGDLALKGAGVASKWLEGKKQKKQVELIKAQTASAEAVKRHTDSVTAGVDADNVPKIMGAEFYKDNPSMGYYGPLLKPANSAFKAAATVLGIRGAGRAFGSGLKKSWGTRPPRKGKGKLWSAAENREWSRKFGFDGKPRKKGY